MKSRKKLHRVLVENPAVSEAQRRYLNSTFGHDWVKEHHFDNKGPLPSYKKKKLVANRRRLTSNKGPSPLKLDPTRTHTLRRQLLTEVRKRFDLLRGRIIKLVRDDDAFGLITNANPDQPRDDRGRFTVTGYHGTASEFTTFEPNAPTTPGGKDLKGIYFSGDQRSAGSYASMAKKRGGTGPMHVIAAELTMDNPLDITKSIAKWRKKGMSFGDAKRKALEDLKPEHDGVVFKGNAQNPPEYIIFDASKAKVKKPTSNDFNPNQPRTPDGRFGLTEGVHIVKASELLHTPLRHTVGAAIRGIKAKVGEKITEYIDRVPGGRFLREKLGALNAKLKERYGEKTMGRIVAAANIVSWGASIGGIALTGVPVIIPSSALILTGAVLAEAHLQGRRALKAAGVVNAKVDIRAEAENLIRQLLQTGQREDGAYLVDIKDIRGHDEGAVPRGPIFSSGEHLPPLAMGHDGYLTDGHHRLSGLKLGGQTHAWVKIAHLPVVNDTRQFAAATDPEAVRRFKEWLRTQFDATGLSDKQLWEKYAQLGYRKGVGRAFDDVRSPKRATVTTSQQLDFYAGTRDEFLRTSFGSPITIERLESLAERSFTDLENVTDDMAARMGRTLMDGLARGDNPRDLASDLMDDLDVSRGRAETIARTEIIRAHSEGQLDSLKALGVEEVGVQVEWMATNDDRVCPSCADMQGAVYEIDEARGLIPAHPNCRCCFVPSIPSELSQNRRRQVRNFNPDQPRDDHGQFTSGGADLLHSTLALSHHLSGDQKAKASAALNYVLAKLPPAAHERLSAHIDKVEFHGTTKELTQSLATTSDKVKAAMDRGATVNGVYRSQLKTLVLNGDVPRKDTDDIWKKDRVNAHETYAHEITHAIDGPGFPLSSDKEWVDAWQREIGFVRPEPGKVKLSNYATSMPAEGFAEFGRLVYGTNTDRAAIEKKFPCCVAYWKKLRLFQ